MFAFLYYSFTQLKIKNTQQVGTLPLRLSLPVNSLAVVTDEEGDDCDEQEMEE